MRLFTFCNTCLSAVSSRLGRSLQYYVLLIRFLLLLLFLGSLEILFFSFTLEAFARTATPSEAVRVPVASASDAERVDDAYLEFLEDYLNETDDITTMELMTCFWVLFLVLLWLLTPRPWRILKPLLITFSPTLYQYWRV